jgi:hypothetical protein
MPKSRWKDTITMDLSDPVPEIMDRIHLVQAETSEGPFGSIKGGEFLV